MKVFSIDIDGTVCEEYTPDGVEIRPITKRLPSKDRIEKINKLYDEGNVIIYWTARWTVTQIDWLDLTKNQLNEWGVKLHDVRVGKPQYDLWIDDKSKTIELLWNQKLYQK